MLEACVILNDIHIDIIKPAYCNEAQVFFSLGFRPTFRVTIYSSLPDIVSEHVD